MKKIVVMARMIALMSVIGVVLFSGGVAQAQSTGLGINPRKDLTVNSGSSATGTLYVNNLNRELPIKINLSIIDFASADETGTPELQLNPDLPQTAWSLKPFLTIPKSVTLQPGEAKYLDFTVKIPDYQGAGSYYSAIQYTADASGNGNVVLNASPATLMFVTVPGRATELMTLKRFGAFQFVNETTGGFKSLFIKSPPKSLAFLLENGGTVAENPRGAITIKNIFGKTMKTIDNANPKSNLALIGQTRRFDVCIEAKSREVVTDDNTTKTVDECQDPKLAPGIYTAQLDLLYGINGSNTQELNGRTVFWYLPFWFLGIILVVLALLALAIYQIRKKLIGQRASHRRRR